MRPSEIFRALGVFSLWGVKIVVCMCVLGGLLLSAWRPGIWSPMGWVVDVSVVEKDS